MRATRECEPVGIKKSHVLYAFVTRTTSATVAQYNYHSTSIATCMCVCLLFPNSGNWVEQSIKIAEKQMTSTNSNEN